MTTLRLRRPGLLPPSSLPGSFVAALLAALLTLTACSGEPAAQDPGSAPVMSAPATSAPATSTQATASPAPASGRTVWLCRPGMKDNPCEGGLDATALSATGPGKVTRFSPAVAPKADCFYVYPTVSEAPSTNAPRRATTAEVRTVRAQAARFGAVCRVFAPVYRQLTVQALTTGKFGDQAGRELAHADVLQAWDDFLAETGDRPFVLIGHSQGSFELQRLLQERVDGVPALRARLVSALLLGGNLKVPAGKAVGGDLQEIPLCTSAAEQGCVITYNTYDRPPPATALFGRPDPQRMLVAACVNPAALGGGKAVLSPLLPTAALAPGLPPVGGTSQVRTGFVSAPDYVSAQCQQRDGAAWLQVSFDRSPGDTRPTVPLSLGPDWGLHLVDVNIALGDLVDVVRTQVAAR